MLACACAFLDSTKKKAGFFIIYCDISLVVEQKLKERRKHTAMYSIHSSAEYACLILGVFGDDSSRGLVAEMYKGRMMSLLIEHS